MNDLIELKDLDTDELLYAWARSWEESLDDYCPTFGSNANELLHRYAGGSLSLQALRQAWKQYAAWWSANAKAPMHLQVSRLLHQLDVAGRAGNLNRHHFERAALDLSRYDFSAGEFAYSPCVVENYCDDGESWKNIAVSFRWMPDENGLAMGRRFIDEYYGEYTDDIYGPEPMTITLNTRDRLEAELPWGARLVVRPYEPEDAMHFLDSKSPIDPSRVVPFIKTWG